THGTLSFANDGSFTYTPDVGYIGPDSFTYIALDSSLAASAITTVNISVSPRLIIPINLAATPGGTVTVPVNIDTPNPFGTGGLNGVIVAINYDTAVFSVSQTIGPAGDFNQGTVTATWVNITPSVEAATGEIGVGLTSGTPNTSTEGGSVVLITFHVLPGAPAGPTRINLMQQNSPFNIPVTTGLDTQSGQPLPLRPAATNANNDLYVDGIVYIGNHFSVVAPSNVATGANFNFTVTALDGANGTLTGYSGTVQFSSTDAAAVLPLPVTLTNGVGIFPATLKTAGTHVLTATDTVTATFIGFSNPIAAAAAAPGTETTHFSVTGTPANVTAGNSFDFTVTALDASESTVTGYTGTVLFASTDPLASFATNNVTLTNGVGTFNVTLKTAGDQTITATDTTTPSITGTSDTITVLAAAATHFDVVTASGTTTAGNPLGFTVTALDAFENTATSYTGTVAFITTDPLGTFASNNVTLTNGQGSFNVTLRSAGPHTITATDATTPSITGTSNTVTVVAAAASHFDVVTASSTTTAGKSLGFSVTALDAFDNTATSYTGTVAFTSTDTQATFLSNNVTLTGGQGSFNVT
ncbi:MAG: beta strand repeat-containing protein, partial [Longimicrobiales bacterium]